MGEHWDSASGRTVSPAQPRNLPGVDIGVLIYAAAWGWLCVTADTSERKPMAASLYDLSVPTYQQTVSAVAGFLDRAAAHCAETGADPDNFVDARLFDDMAPFHFQVECVAHHSVWALEAMRTGAFAPPALVGPVPFADLRAMIADAEAALKAFTPEEVNGWSGKALDLQIGPRRLAFTSETFFLSFSLPNFHFHAVTAYDILRSRSVPLGKRDYEGRLRTGPA
jgi:hypothetical protein